MANDPVKIGEESEYDSQRANELEALKQKQRLRNLNRAKNLARIGSIAAMASGHSEAAEFLTEAGELAHSGGHKMNGDNGALRNSGSNVAGKLAARAARGKGAGNNTPNAVGGKLTGGQAAALGGAVAGALKGENASGIAKSALGWYVLWFMFGFLTLDLILSPALVPILLALAALAYLDFHYIISKIKKGKGFFVTLSVTQKAILFLAHFLIALVFMVVVGFLYTGYAAVCSAGASADKVGYFIPYYPRPLMTMLRNKACPPPESIVAKGGASGGGGATGDFNDLVSLVGLVNVDTISTSDPRARQCMADVLVQLFADAEAQGLDITITSAYRGNGTTAEGGASAHGRGEAVDIALRNPTVPWNQATHSLPAGFSDPRIGRLVAIGQKYFFKPAGDTLDEYHFPAKNATGGHVHVEYNIPSSGSYCDGTAK
ncbi:MAG: hypothetical protein KW802_04220 [Candidatus Doudnabacteria bacterium]|nr:hypothetical protein [Candidatus Doudnabacteria bacterium]